MNEKDKLLGRRGFLKGAVVSSVAGVVAFNTLMAAEKEATPAAACIPSWG